MTTQLKPASDNQDQNRPLVSFVVLAYRQEQFIREAVEGAFGQTYSPLEIILSDDCSPDRTFAIMQEMADSYAGPHRIILNRNPKNLGIGAHVNRCMELASGEWIVAAAGDDISLPERTVRLAERWIISGGDLKLVYSDYFTMQQATGELCRTNTGKTTQELEPVYLCRNHFAGVTGASNSWHKDLFSFFGPMQNNVVFEDRVLAFRAALLGTMQHLSEPLMHYRRHGENTVEMFHRRDVRETHKMIGCLICVYENNALDLSVFERAHPEKRDLVRACRREMKHKLAKLKAYDQIMSGSPVNVFIGLCALVAARGNPIAGLRMAVRALCQ